MWSTSYTTHYSTCALKNRGGVALTERGVVVEKHFKISDFAEKIGKHPNTVDGWFKKMEQKRIHCVSRVDNEKVYDELDLAIGLHIDAKRSDGWSLQAIFNELDEHFDLRPFPEDMRDPVAIDLEVVRRKFTEDMQASVAAVVREQVEAAVGEVRQQYAELMNQLPKPRDPAEERQERITDIITRRRVEATLRNEALQLWSTKPEKERIRRTGLFGIKKEEDHAARDLFVMNYIDEHFETRLKKEFNL